MTGSRYARMRGAAADRLALLLVLSLVASLAMVGSPEEAAGSEPPVPSLWLVDDGTDMTYNVTPDGDLNFSFATPRNAVSSVALDPTDQSLWGANDGATSRLVNYTYEVVDGQAVAVVLQEILGSEFGAVSGEGVAVTFNPGNDTLWVVDDPLISSELEPTVFNITQDGTLISSFPTSTFDPASRSPQAIAFDQYTDTLWITDNSADKIYNVTFNGTLISTIPLNVEPFSIRNVQGVSVESANVLWLTARDTDLVYRISTDGTILSTFSISHVDANAGNPTGVAYDPGSAALRLGEAGSFAMLGLAGAKLKLEDVAQASGVVGDVGLSAGAKQEFNDGLLTGSYIVDPGADNDQSHDVVISGETLTADLSQAVTDALDLASTSAALPSDFTFDEIKTNTVVVGAPGINVIDTNKIELDGETLRLEGFPTSVFIINVGQSFKLKNGSSMQLTGGVDPTNVLVNITGGSDSAIEGGSVAAGTILAPAAKMKIKDQGSFLLGSIIGGEEIKLESGGRLRSFSEAITPGTALAPPGVAVVALPGTKAKLKDPNSLVSGDVLLGPASEQDFDSGVIAGTLQLDPTANASSNHAVEISGGTVEMDLSRVVADLVDTSTAYANMTPAQSFDEIEKIGRAHV